MKFYMHLVIQCYVIASESFDGKLEITLTFQFHIFFHIYFHVGELNRGHQA